ncbi:MAG: FHA domain-containing protein [Bacteroidaceae bacterium]|nr:FHA domain-containing protein [Bacteroidaceae bacterium]
MEIIIGRDQQTRQLCIVKDGSTKLYGQPGSVPMDVSRHHISLEPVGAGKWKIKNLNERNVTFVNGIAVESKTVSENDKIELGNSHYLLSWDALSEPKVETIDIGNLKIVWEEYNQANMGIRKRQKNIGLLASIPIGITMLGGLLSSLAPGNLKPFAYVFTAIALVVMLYGFYRRFTDNSIEEQEEIKKTFQRRYVCPKCGHFMGFTDYDILIQNDSCPYCKTKYKK